MTEAVKFTEEEMKQNNDSDLYGLGSSNFA